MVLFHKVIMIAVISLALCACSGSEEAQVQPSSQETLPSPQFALTEDPRELVDNYLKDLQSEQVFPSALVQELEGSTSLKNAKTLIARHHTISFIEWYFSEPYLRRVKDLVARKVKRLDYQLKVLDVSEADASDVLFVIEAGPLAHRLALQNGAFQQVWQPIDDKNFSVILKNQGYSAPLRVVRESDRWKLELTHL